MTVLESLIKEKIKKSGSIDIAEFMDMALGHPDYGYYMTRDPLGVDGDFVTAPEVSQIFGELIGAWVADIWIRSGRPDYFSLVECGPGRGTLMCDALRATRNIPGFHDALSIFLLEMSPVLKGKQKEMLSDYEVTWIDGIKDPALARADGPVIFIANEFLDALPIRQLVHHKGAWHERVIDLDSARNLVFRASPYVAKVPVSVSGQEADIYEISPARESFVEKICEFLLQRQGAALFIDYGHDTPSVGDTLQAVKNHQYVPVLSNIGEADLTSHVDFSRIIRVAKGSGVGYSAVIEQGAFLNSLGIQFRAQALLDNAAPEQKEDILRGVNRLTAADQMGRLFKAVTLHHIKNQAQAGQV